MKKKNLLLALFLLLASILLWSVIRGRNEDMAASAFKPDDIHIKIDSVEKGYPAPVGFDTIVRHVGYHLRYNEAYEQASWVVYILTREEVESGNEERSENFRPDTSIKTGSASLRDYSGSGYDRGHLAPAADMKWSPAAMSESFLLSNMSPQVPGFNRGVWSRLETKVRQWAVENDSLLVITGPVLGNIDTFIGENRVGVPKYYYKVIADISSPTYKSIAFLIENKSSSADLFSFAVTIDSLEKVTGFNFFSRLPDQDAIEWMESRLDLSSWR
jgi:endonuclease G